MGDFPKGGVHENLGGGADIIVVWKISDPGLLFRQIRYVLSKKIMS